MKDLRSCIKGIWYFSKPVRWEVALTIFLGLVRVAASLCFVWLSKRLVDIATGLSSASITVYAIAFVLTILVQISSNIASSYWANMSSIKAQNYIRYNLFSKVLRSSWCGREDYHSGDIINRIQEDSRVVVEIICSRIPDATVTLIQLLAASIYLLTLAPGLLLVLVLLMIVAILGSKMFYKIIRTLTARIRELDSLGQQHIQENIQNRIVILTLVGIDKVLSKLGIIQKESESVTRKRMTYGAVARFFMSAGLNAGYLLAFFWGVFGIRSGAVTYGMMTAFLQLVGQIQRPLADLSRHLPAFIHALTSEERLSELYNIPSDLPYEGRLYDTPPAIRFENVSFSYPGKNNLVLDKFSYEFEPGLITVVLGPTGRGKSTLVRLAMGLLKPSEGRVTPLSISNFMYVPQGNTLMSGTIKENLLLSCSDASQQQMEEVLHLACADFVFDLPDGLETKVGEVGSGLSEGQCQRIAIARALLHSGTVLILDEATSALDGATESEFLSHLSLYKGRKSIIFITHRESVIKHADRILSL